MGIAFDMMEDMGREHYTALCVEIPAQWREGLKGSITDQVGRGDNSSAESTQLVSRVDS